MFAIQISERWHGKPLQPPGRFITGSAFWVPVSEPLQLAGI
jgi:hypothetical protein